MLLFGCSAGQQASKLPTSKTFWKTSILKVLSYSRNSLFYIFCIVIVVQQKWVWGNGGMILTGETEVLGEKYYTAWVVGGWMGIDQWWNGTDRGRLWYWEKNILQLGWQVVGWVWSNGGMIVTGKLKYWEKKISSVGDRRMEGYGVMVDRY